MKHPKEVFHVYSISKLMMISMKELGMHTDIFLISLINFLPIVHLNQDFQ